MYIFISLVDSRWNPRISIVENIHLPPTLLSRFDLIYLILDAPDRVKDRKLAKHLIGACRYCNIRCMKIEFI